MHRVNELDMYTSQWNCNFFSCRPLNGLDGDIDIEPGGSSKVLEKVMFTVVKLLQIH